MSKDKPKSPGFYTPMDIAPGEYPTPNPSDSTDFPKGGRPMVAGQPAADRIMRALDNRLTGEPKPTRKQVAMVLHAMADHTAIMRMVNYDMRALYPYHDKKTRYWPVETSIGRWMQSVAYELGDSDE